LVGWFRKERKKKRIQITLVKFCVLTQFFDKDYSLMGFSGLKLSQDDWRTLLLLHVKNKLKEIEVAGDNLT
jgi:hypothetical protein